MVRNLSLLSSASLLTLTVVAASALRLIPEEPIIAQTNPIANPERSIKQPVKINPMGDRPIHPDESIEETLNNRFSLTDALKRLSQINSSLTSFRQLTEQTKGKGFSVGNTDWETQNLGFPNWTTSVEGTLRKQNYQIKKLELELAQKQYADREISKATLDKKAQEYKQAEQAFNAFWNAAKIAD